MMRTSLALLLFVIPGPPGPAVHFRYERPFTEPASRNGQTCLALPADVFAHAAPGLADVRLYDQGTEIPYAVHIPPPPGTKPATIAALNAGQRGGRTVFDAAMPAGSYSDVELLSTARNFIASVTVSGSRGKDGGPATKFGSFTIFDLTKERLGRSTTLHLPETDFRSLHFEITGPLRPEEVEGLTLPGDSAAETRFTPVAQGSPTQQRGRDSVTEFRVPAHTPAERVRFAVGPEPAEFSRDVHITVRPETERVPVTDASSPPPEPMTFSGSLLRLHRNEDGQQIDEERLGVDVAAPSSESATRWTVTVANGDDAPLGLEGVRLEMQERDLCFEAKSGSTYALYYGDPGLTSPRFDYAALFTPGEAPAQAALGPEVANPQFEPRPDQRPFTERHPALLWMALLAVVALLGGVAARSALHSKPGP